MHRSSANPQSLVIPVYVVHALLPLRADPLLARETPQEPALKVGAILVPVAGVLASGDLGLAEVATHEAVAAGASVLAVFGEGLQALGAGLEVGRAPVATAAVLALVVPHHHATDAVAVLADLETWEGAQAVVDAAIEQFGRVDVAVPACTTKAGPARVTRSRALCVEAV